MRGDRIPPLATTGVPGTPVGLIGVLGVPGTQVLFGDERINGDPRSGIRLSAGMWLDACQTIGIGIEGFWLSNQNDGFSGLSNGSPALARPVFNTMTGLPDAQVLAFPGVAASQLVIASESNVCGFGAFARKLICQPCLTVAFEGLVGYRYLNLDEEITLSESLTANDPTPGAPPIGTQFTLLDSYRTRTQFHCADVGLAASWSDGRFFADVVGKVALGCNVREYTVGGVSTTTVSGVGTVVTDGGLYTVGLNGRTTDQVFAVVPELRLNLGCRVSDCVRVFAGYNLLCWTNVARAGEQISLNVDPAQLPPPLVPIVPRPVIIESSTLWMHGFNLGIVVSF